MSKLEVNAVEPQCGTNLTLGASGDTIIIPSGATISNQGTAAGFGPTGAVSWNTTKITADPNPAVSGVGYFADTTSAAFTITLPSSPSAGAVIGIADYANTFATNNLTVDRNGSNIGGNAFNATLSVNGVSVTFVYVDATQGWIVTDSGQRSNLDTATYIVATGGTITCDGDFKIHTFTGPGTFTVTSVGNPVGSDSVDYLIVAGGGGGAARFGGGGGAGGYRESSGAASGCYSVSPLGSGVSAVPVSAQGYPISVGGGGSAGTTPACNGGAGSPSSGLTITSTGGGASGVGNSTPNYNAGTGGSGGGGGSPGCAGAGFGGSGNTPPVAPPQGNNGGNGFHDAVFAALGGGGGGATTAGSTVVPNNPLNTPVSFSGPGGNGATSSINGTSTTRSGGGGGGTHPVKPTTYGIGGPGGGGPGGAGGSAVGVAGTVNTGGGGGGGSGCSNGGAGGSGIVVIRYKFQN
jgi:hypothetical protein